MTDEEFQKLIYEKLIIMENMIKLIKAELSEIKQSMATKAYVECILPEQQKEIVTLLQLVDKKVDQIASTQTIQGESINILAMRQLQSESEIATLKKAK